MAAENAAETECQLLVRELIVQGHPQPVPGVSGACFSGGRGSAA